jgi:HPt (histidine-containing phosphotransfer) domain-containing protein
VLDRNQLEESCMGSSDLRKVLIQTFLGEIFPRLARLGNRVAAGDNVGVEFEAHGLKGMCAALGAKRCADAFVQLERMGCDLDLGGAQAAIDRAEDEVTVVSRVVGALIEASDSAAPSDDESSARAA